MKNVLLALTLCSLTCMGQAPGAPPAVPAAGAAPAAAAPRVVLPPLNEVDAVDADRFFGKPGQNPVHLSHGTLLTHAILQAGDPDHPGLQGDVLQYRKLLATAELMPGGSTPLETYPDEYFFFVKDGEGRLDDGKQAWDLKAGDAILIAPTLAHRFVNKSTEKSLHMIMLQWTAGPAPSKTILVRDTQKIGWCEENAHWNNTSRCIFSAADGLIQGERIYTVMLQPWAVSQPHSHTIGTEEVWTKLSPGSIPVLMGSNLYEMSEDMAYLVVPTGKIDHANINVSHDKVEWWLYVARGPAQTGPPRQGGGGNANRPVNPNITHEVEQSNVPSHPLK